MVATRKTVLKRLPAKDQLHPMSDADWRVWLERLRFSTVAPLGEVICTALGLQPRPFGKVIAGPVPSNSAFHRLYRLTLPEVRPSGGLTPVLDSHLKLPDGEQAFVDAVRVYEWLKAKDMALPVPLSAWLDDRAVVYARWKLEGPYEEEVLSAASVEQIEAQLQRHRDERSADVAPVNAKLEERTLANSWEALAYVVLHNCQKDLAAESWQFVPSGKYAEEADTDAGMAERAFWKGLDPGKRRHAIVNHVATALVSLLGKEECERRGYSYVVKKFEAKGHRLPTGANVAKTRRRASTP